MSFAHLETVYLNILKYELTLYIAYIILNTYSSVIQQNVFS